MLPDWLKLRGEISKQQEQLRSCLVEGWLADRIRAQQAQQSSRVTQMVSKINGLIDQHTMRVPSLEWQLPRLAVLQTLPGFPAQEVGERAASSSVTTGHAHLPAQGAGGPTAIMASGIPAGVDIA